MHLFITLCGAVGAWLLVAGPVYQAAIELHEQEVDRDAIDATVASITKPPRISWAWWLLPPVAYVKQQRRERAYRRSVMSALGQEQIEQTVRFLNKATGWMIVAAGAFLIAMKETWELIELLEWPWWVWLVIVIVLAIASVANAAANVWRTEQMLKRDEEAIESLEASEK